MIDFKQIKLIIWDLDDTFWNGTISEGEIELCNENVQLIKELTDCGIVNSICSKNDVSVVEKILVKYSLYDFFVFKSINWEPKGKRVQQIVQDMGLRFPNVLFLDDNISNLKEVEFYCEGIMLGGPELIPDLRKKCSLEKKRDITHKRLRQYQLLEEKHKKSLEYNSNEEFLYSCNIQLQFHRDCLSESERLFELVNRTNQLNFTKKRPSYGDFIRELNSCDSSGYVTVQDKFGDYGIVGFFLVKGGDLVHFLFSCRTIGQGVEQYVYSKLGFPRLNVVGEVATSLDDVSEPGWINQNCTSIEYNESKSSNDFSNCRFLFKGPCDMRGMVGYLQLPTNMSTEFTFIDDEGHSIENYNHSIHIMGLCQYKKINIDNLMSDCFFIKEQNFTSSIYVGNYDIIFLSTLIEANYGIYERVGTGEKIAFGHYDYPLTDKKYWDGYISNLYPTYGYKFTRDFLEGFSLKYRFLGRTEPCDYISFLEKLQNNLPSKCYICLILGSEIPYHKEKYSSYLDRHIYHKRLNDVIKEYSKYNSRIKYIEITKHIMSQEDFTNNINHFTPNVYYALSKEILNLINELCGVHLALSKNASIRLFVKKYVQPLILKCIPSNSSVYNLLKEIYFRIVNK